VLDAGHAVEMETSAEADSMRKGVGWFKHLINIWVDGNSKILEMSAFISKDIQHEVPCLASTTSTFPTTSTDYVTNVNDWHQRKPSSLLAVDP
jgi:hypothetical protein